MPQRPECSSDGNGCQIMTILFAAGPGLAAAQTRNAAPADEAAWRRLWAGYLAFFGKSLPEAVTATTWRRLLDPTSSMIARLAIRDDAVVGFALCVLHAGTWVTTPICYLEDLFVDPAVRGTGVGRALIEDLVRLGTERGWSRLHWHARSGNGARVLYDRFTLADDAVHYQLELPGPAPAI